MTTTAPEPAAPADLLRRLEDPDVRRGLESRRMLENLLPLVIGQVLGALIGLCGLFAGRAVADARSAMDHAVAALIVVGTIAVTLLIAWAGRTIERRSARRRPRQATEGWVFRQSPDTVRRIMIAYVVALSLVGFVLAAFDPEEWATLGVAYLLGGLGGATTGAGLWWRSGDEPHCAVCEYDVGAAPGTIPELCPECGAAWHEPGGVRLGRFRTHPRRVWAGIGLLATAFLVAFVARVAR